MAIGVAGGYSNLSSTASTSPTASISPPAGISTQLTAVQQLQAMNQGHNYNAKYTPSISTLGAWGTTAFTYGPIGQTEEMPTGKTPVERLKRALMLASGNQIFWNPMHQVCNAYTPGYVKDVAKLRTIKNRLIKDIKAADSSTYMAGSDNSVNIYAMAIKASDSPTLFTYMAFRAFERYTATASLPSGDDFFTIPNSFLFIASQHKEFSIVMVPCTGEEGSTLTAVKKFIDGFCDVNVKPLMTNLVYESMDSIVFIAPTKRIASLAKAMFDGVRYITSRQMPNYKDENVKVEITGTSGYTYSVDPSSYISGGITSPWTATVSGITVTAGSTTSRAAPSSNGTYTWIDKAHSTLTNGVNSIFKYFTSDSCSS